MGDVVEGPNGLVVTARNFGLKGPRGWAFRGIGFDADPGALVAVRGPSGSGRTCLLLALTGRMRATEGSAEVGGLPLPKRMAALRRISALAHVAGLTDLDPALTVGEHLHERALLQRRFGDSLRALLRPRGEHGTEERLRIGAALRDAGLDLATLPKGPRTAVRDLERAESLRLSIALALLARPRLLGVDDTDLKLSSAERAEVWDLLRSLAGNGVTVVAVCSEAPEGAVVVDTTAAQDTAEPSAARGTAEPSADEATGTTEHSPDDETKEAADALAETGRS
ncbi:ATP-binding cassette domain-containing protein [Streptomyces sp. NPDC005931]|uniref:ATP-binding cassette domain-containing protein n=1 Tax=Streptomyces sp. NPDC005931 TaxID=3364737 RepID=UPI00368E9DE2